MKLRSHPSDARLARWLETGEPTRVGRHVAGCEQCMGAVEELTSLDRDLVADIAEVLAPPPGIEERTARQVERRLRDEDALMAFLDLFSVGLSTLRMLAEGESDRGTEAGEPSPRDVPEPSDRPRRPDPEEPQ